MRELPTSPSAVDHELRANRIRIGVVELGLERAPAGQRNVDVHRVAATDALAVAAQVQAIEPRRTARVGGDVDELRVRREAREARDEAVPRERRDHGAGRRCRARAAAGCADIAKRRRARDRIPPRGPPLGEADPERRPRVGIVSPGEEPPARDFDEAPHARRVGARDRERAVEVDAVPTREPWRADGERVERRQPATERCGAGEHRELGAGKPTTATELGLVVHGQPLEDPRRRIRVGEEQCGAPEDALCATPDPSRAVEVEDVRQLVRHEDQVPVLVIAECRRVDRRPRVDHDPVAGIRRRVPVGEVDVVGEHQIHGAARRHELRAQPRVGELGVPGRPPCEFLELSREVHTEMRRGERAPLEVWTHLSCGAPGIGDTGEQEGQKEGVDAAHGAKSIARANTPHSRPFSGLARAMLQPFSRYAFHSHIFAVLP